MNTIKHHSLLDAALSVQIRAEALGLNIPVDQLKELIAAEAGYGSATEYETVLAQRQPPALKLMEPNQTGADFELVGNACFVVAGNFSIHILHGDDGLKVDVYAKDAEDDSSMGSVWLDKDYLNMVTSAHIAATYPDVKSFLETAGYEFAEDSDQPGMWIWKAPTENCDQSFATQLDAVNDAWKDMSGITMALNNLSDEDWDALSMEKKISLMKEALED